MEDMKRQIFNLLQAHIPLAAAYSLVAASDAQIKALESDDQFMRTVHFYEARQEQLLLERLNNIMDMNESKGISTEVRWLLSKKFPTRYGSRQVVVTESPDLPAPNIRTMVADDSEFDDSEEL